MGKRECKCSQTPAQPKVGSEHVLPSTVVTQAHFLALLVNLEVSKLFLQQRLSLGSMQVFCKRKIRTDKVAIPITEGKAMLLPEVTSCLFSEQALFPSQCGMLQNYRIVLVGKDLEDHLVQP